MTKKTFAALLLAASATLAGPVAFAADPTLHEVYQAAESGRLAEAQGMMAKVLKEHPNSGKAHFVEAELLAKQGEFGKAREELANAERLSPGLSFAKPQAVENLKSLLRGGHGAATQQPNIANFSAAPAAPTPGIPWAMLLGGIGLIAFIVWAVRLMASRTPAPSVPAPAGGVPAGYGPAAQSYGGYGAPMPTSGSGLGGKIMGGLATGAAVGAGVIAGEAIARHFMHDDGNVVQHDGGSSLAPSTDNVFNDMGGNDFGVTDGGSWDDGGSSDSDWN